MTARNRVEKLPPLLERKLYKTGQTRGASVREIYQNRVSRNSTVLIPHAFWEQCKAPYGPGQTYENGFIVLVEPSWYFTATDPDELLNQQGLRLGTNALLLFLKRSDLVRFAPAIDSTLPNGMTFTAATSRIAPLGGVLFSRIHSTTALSNGRAVVHGFDETSIRGAGIRVYEYASSEMIGAARLQLECLIWMSHDSVKVMSSEGMTEAGATHRRNVQLANAVAAGLLDLSRLREARMIDDNGNTICPLCLDKISAAGFLKREEQAEGRAVYDLTVTELSLFHIDELRIGKLQHRPYNLSWGHHFCNIVVKDAGIIPTLEWMKRVVDNNGHSWKELEKRKALIEKTVEM
ncbi:BstXI family restriction endonuclease [Arthrobacter echini]|uniref:BstXI family restriction endonuclease n=1 Tax=Arthrobacter echini TaxID=1529066 RepID=A0A5D0XVL1_9MICC|nr:BstXI family restriction endonuclease [Arthrobacter echini]